MDEQPQEPQSESVLERHPQWKTWAAACGLAAALFIVCVVVAVNVMGAADAPAGGAGEPMTETRAEGSGGGEPMSQGNVEPESGADEQEGAASNGGSSEAPGLIAGQQPETATQTNAFMAAKLHMSEMPYSRASIISVLQSEGYSYDDAVYAADKLGVDWNAKAAEMAQQYVDTMEFTREDLLDQLMYEGFTAQEAAAGVAAIGM